MGLQVGQRGQAVPLGLRGARLPGVLRAASPSWVLFRTRLRGWGDGWCRGCAPGEA